ncbi:MAG TPA: prepilin-type N-terminal cleavage/methylation domain-containing protein [Noviherbaspirillum sp.]
MIGHYINRRARRGGLNSVLRHRGFTLIELLVAITVLAVVAVLGWRGLDSIVRARIALNNDLEQTRGLQLAFAQMQSDCAQIATAKSISGRPVLAAEAGQLELVRYVFAENQPTRLQVVSYRVREGKLTRRESLATRDLKELDASWLAAAGDSETAPAVVLQNDVSDMSIRSWDGTKWVIGVPAADSVTATPTAASQAVPAPATAATTSGLEVALRLHDRPDRLVKIFLLGAT